MVDVATLADIGVDDGLRRFLNLVVTEDSVAAALGARIDSDWKAETSSPELAFIARVDGRDVGRLALTLPKGLDREARIYAVVLPQPGETGKGADPTEIGSALLARVVDAAKARGVRRIIRQVVATSPAALTENRLFAAQPRWRVRQIKAAYAFEADRLGKRTPATAPLQFASLEEVGEDTFIAALARGMTGTHDPDDAERIKRVGLESAAAALWKLLKSYDHDPAWWELATDTGGETAGVVVPVRLGPQQGTIGYVAVTPERRHRGHATRLLARATETLIGAGLPRIYADTDVDNVAMRRAFTRYNYRAQGLTRFHAIDL